MKRNTKHNYISPTKINDYNQFLITMDKKNAITLDACGNQINHSSLHTYVDFIQKKIIYQNLSSPHYTGLLYHDIVHSNLEIDNVNGYTDTTLYPKILNSNSKILNLKKKNISLFIDTHNIEDFEKEKKNDHEDGTEKGKDKKDGTINKKFDKVISPIIKTKKNIDKEINCIQDLLDLIEDNPLDITIEYNIDMKSLHNIKKPLKDLNNMIGMKELKKNIVDQILYFIQKLHILNNKPDLEEDLSCKSNDDDDSICTIKKCLDEIKLNIIDKCCDNKNKSKDKDKDKDKEKASKKHKKNKTRHDPISGDFMHTVIYGPPGTGKTEIAKIMGYIYSNIGILKSGTFKKVTRSDLIAGYLGQTAIKTREIVEECLGGVLFIDEAYALGNPEKRDSFAKECIDTLCEALSDHKDELMVIIAGYEDELNDCFFNYNQGLDSRFTWRFKTDQYKETDLYEIFMKKVKDIGWTISDDKIQVAWFKKNMSSFPFFGRDMETLLAKTKIAHSKRVFCKPVEEKKQITLADLEKGYEMYMQNENIKKTKEKEQMKKIMSSIYV